MSRQTEFRIYTFQELMSRLRSKAWEVSVVKDGFVFVPAAYKPRPKQGGLF